MTKPLNSCETQEAKRQQAFESYKTECLMLDAEGQIRVSDLEIGYKEWCLSRSCAIRLTRKKFQQYLSALPAATIVKGPLFVYLRGYRVVDEIE